jgi:DNA polymerase-3 subunit epsilon
MILLKLSWLRIRNRCHRWSMRNRDLPQEVRQNLLALDGIEFGAAVADISFVIFDLETTGVDAAGGDRVVSISALRMKSGRIDLADAFYSLVNPVREIPARSVVVHGILPGMVDGKPTIETLLPDFLRYVGASVLVGHQSWFDLSFLNREMKQLYGFPIQNPVLDTAVLDGRLEREAAAALNPGGDPADRRLASLARRYRVDPDGLHSSFGDALTTARIFQQMLKVGERSGIRSLGELLAAGWAASSGGPGLGLSAH